MRIISTVPSLSYCKLLCYTVILPLTSSDADINATAHGVIIEQNPAYNCVPVHLKPTGHEYKEIDMAIDHHRLKAV